MGEGKSVKGGGERRLNEWIKKNANTFFKSKACVFYETGKARERISLR